jgi:hypothetical protein
MAAPDVSSGNVAGLMAFLDFMISKGYGTAGAINPWRSAAKNVFAVVEGDDFEDFDVRSFDVDEYLARFENRSMGKYTADSLAAYRSRFRKAIEAYRSYLADPNWKPNASRRPVINSGKETTPTRPRTKPAEESSQPPLPSSPSLIAYPFPLKSGQMAQLHLPTQLEREDAERLTQFIRALVLEQPRQLASGPADDA